MVAAHSTAASASLSARNAASALSPASSCAFNAAIWRNASGTACSSLT